MATTINLAVKHSAKIEQEFTAGSILQGRLENKLDFLGAKTVRVHTINSTPLNDYDRGANSNRYGEPTEVGDSLQDLTMTQDKSFTGIIDKGNSADQNIKKATQYLRVEINEAVIPNKDKYAFNILANKAGYINASKDALTEANVIKRMSAARERFVNKRVTMKMSTWYVKSSIYSLLFESKPFIGLDKIGSEALITGQVGKLWGSPVVEVPEDLCPKGFNFMLINKRSATSPAKIEETKVHIDPPGISGHLVEGRYYFDTFVFGAKANGIYVDVFTGTNGGTQLATPTITATTGAITAVGGGTVMYTVDGTDPRYSVSAKMGNTAPKGAGTVVKAYQFKEDNYPSAVAEVTLTE